MAVMVSLVAEDVLLIMAGYLGSTTIAPMKYFWWLTTVFFSGEVPTEKSIARLLRGASFASCCLTTSCDCAVLVSYQLLPTTADKHAIYKNCVYAVITCLALFNLIWLMG